MPLENTNTNPLKKREEANNGVADDATPPVHIDTKDILINSLTYRVNEKNARVNELEGENRRLLDELAARDASVHRQKLQIREQDYILLNDENLNLDEANKGLHNLIAAYKQELERGRESAGESGVGENTLHDQIRRFKAERDTLLQEITELTATVTSLKAENDRLKADTTLLRNDSMHLENQADKLTQELGTYGSELEKLRKRNAMLEEQRTRVYRLLYALDYSMNEYCAEVDDANDVRAFQKMVLFIVKQAQPKDEVPF